MTTRPMRPIARTILMMVMGIALISGCQNWSERSSSTVSGENPAGPESAVSPQTMTLTINVTDTAGAPIAGFRYLVEENVTVNVVPGVQTVTGAVKTTIQSSYAPVLAQGETATGTANVTVPDNKRLMVSVLPSAPGYAMSGKNVAAGQTTVNITVHEPPILSAQISVYVFHDNQPINGAPDLPAEEPLEGFSVIVSDMAGQQMLDVFGNMLGTTYMDNGDGTYSVDMMGDGVIKTDANGEALIKYLAPGKYAVQVIPPSGQGWIQSSTLEGTPVIDAWVWANEPPYFAEWGVFAWHTFYGFIKAMDFPAPTGTVGTITGQAVYVHDYKPPQPPGAEPGRPIPTAWVGLNALDQNDQQVYAGPADELGFFTIPNVPPGTYQLVVFDWALDVIIDFRTVLMPATGGTIDLGKVAAFSWFGFYEGTVFYDENENGMQDMGEMGMDGQAVNLRHMDGTIYKVATTNMMGEFCMPETFPWFHWLVTEVDFTRYKATGATFVIDDGGPLPSPTAVNTPQIQPDTGLPYRTDLGVVLTQAFMLFAGQTNQAYFGKKLYAPGENGGISGLVVYATTRAEDNPDWAGAEPWEPGIPRVQVELYQDTDFDGVIDDLDTNPGPTRADVDNHPFGWAEGGVMGAEDVDLNGNTIFDPGDAINIVTTDSWDDSKPTDCVGPDLVIYGQTVTSCAENVRTWNQMRPGVFDGGWAFASYFPGGMADPLSVETDGLPFGYYIVGAATPPGYELQKEESKNVDFGEEYFPAALQPELGPPACLGEMHTVPPELTLFPGVPAPLAGLQTPLCDLKSVYLGQSMNAAAEFYFFTPTPKAAKIFGMAFSDVALAFDPNDPNKGNNFGPAWLPVSVRNFWGEEVARVYTDEWGGYNALVPSTYTNNLGAPSGMSLNILEICLNHPGPIPDPLAPGSTIIDPWYNPQYGLSCTKWQFLPGVMTRLDTPLLPVGGFAVNDLAPDCNFEGGTPVVDYIIGGPYVATTPAQINIVSRGTVMVPNPDYDPTNPLSPVSIPRDYGFGGTSGQVYIGTTLLGIAFWANGLIIADIPASTPSGVLTIVRGDNGKSSILATTVHIDDGRIPSVQTVTEGSSIQAAIDAAPAGGLVLVNAGVYKENLFITKPIKLQGFSPFHTSILAGPLDPGEQLAWQARLDAEVAAGNLELVPGERPDFFLEIGPGILVGYNSTTTTSPTDPPVIDGLQIMGASYGGGILINAYTDNLRISNNYLFSNQGNLGGGIRVGTPSLINDATGGYYGSSNLNLVITNNWIRSNGGISGGGGISLFKGSDGYRIANNYLCGNFTLLYGGGVSHYGLSDNCTIENNIIKQNESFDEGGGVFLAGELVPAGAPVGILTEGAGSVTVHSNFIVGNMANDDGGGIRTLMFNGRDVSNNPSTPANWHTLTVLDNMIVNNLSTDAGGGISLDDTARAFIINNTIAHNDSTSTAVDAFGGPCVDGVPPGNFCPETMGGLTTSVPQVGGIHARAHRLNLQNAFGAGYEQEFSNPVLEDNIIFENRSFYWDALYNAGIGGIRPDIAGGELPYYWDLGVTATAAPEILNPMNCVLTSLTANLPGGGTANYNVSNTSADPLFVDGSYFNVYAATSKGAALGNFVNTTFYMPGSYGNYLILTGSSAIDLGAGNYLATFPILGLDFEGDTRPLGGASDTGADELE